MGSDTLDVMTDKCSFEIAQLTSTGAGWVTALFKLAFDIFLLEGCWRFCLLYPGPH